MKKILILGSNTFLGSYLVNFVLDKKFKVVCNSRSEEKRVKRLQRK